MTFWDIPSQYDVPTDDTGSNDDIENYSDTTVGDDDIYELSTDDVDSDYGVDDSILISTYINTKMSVCLSVCLYTCFLAISKRIWMPLLSTKVHCL